MVRLQISLIQIQGISDSADKIREALGPKWPEFESEMFSMLEEISIADKEDIRRKVDDLMSMGLNSPAGRIFREIGRKSRADYTGKTLRGGSNGNGSNDEVSTEESAEKLREVTKQLIRDMRGVNREELIFQEDETAMHPHFAFMDISRALRPRELQLHEGFKVSRKYRLTVSIELAPDLRFGDPGSPIGIQRPPEVEAETIDVYVALFPVSTVLAIPNPLSVLKWPAMGPSIDNAKFDIEVAAHSQETDSELDVFFYYKTNILYWARMNIPIRPEGHRWVEENIAITWHHMEDKDEDRSTLFLNFLDIKNLTERGLSLAIHPAEIRDTYLLTAFIERAQFPARITLTRAQLTDNLMKMRALMDNLRRDLAYLEGGYNAAGMYVGDFSNERANFSVFRERAPSVREVYKKFIENMADLGSRFWNALFGRSQSGQELRSIIEDQLEDGEIIQIYIAKGSHDFIYPWAWLYIQEPIDPHYRIDVQKEKFWGYRFIIEQLHRFPEKILAPIQTDELNIKIGVANIEPTTMIQKNYFATLNAKGNGMPVYEIWDSDRLWEEFLSNCNSQILYFYSHGHTAKPITMAREQLYDWISAWKNFVEELPEDNEIAIKRKLSAKENLEDLTGPKQLLDRSFIKLQQGYLLAEELQNLMFLEQSNPLVFLNMCESAQVFPDLSGGLIDVFLEKGARGVIGTEIPMPPAFADLFSREFFEGFLIQKDDAQNPKNIGKVLWELRRKYLNMNNPFGFAYTYFGDVTVGMSDTLVP